MLLPDERICETCGGVFKPHPKNLKKPGKARFCTVSCSSKRQRSWTKTPNVSCAYCHKQFYKNLTKRKASKSGLYFCCREHRDLALRIGTPQTVAAIQPHKYRNKTQPTIHYRDFAFRHYGKRCGRCHFDSVPEILVIHHKDRNRQNNTLDNLEVLCPNCHAIEHICANGTPCRNRTDDSNLEGLHVTNYTNEARE